MSTKTHWETIYSTRQPDAVSWYQQRPRLSLEFIERTGIGKEATIIDVGGGASTLVDHLVAGGYRHVTVLDISAAALAAARARLGEDSGGVTWLEADVTRTDLPEHAYDLWHDRAVFHFLIDRADRDRYVEAVKRAVKPGGHVVVATFALDGPTHCSGLEIARYDAHSLHDAFGEEFRLVDSEREEHHTPAGSTQKFVYCYCRR